MAVMSKGDYGIPEGIVYSFPVTCENGNWEIVKDLDIPEYSREKLDISSKELLEEKEMCMQYLN
jgi:malate/lactate dehydrogenase